jgi:hypothetical protein
MCVRLGNRRHRAGQLAYALASWKWAMLAAQSLSCNASTMCRLASPAKWLKDHTKDACAGKGSHGIQHG